MVGNSYLIALRQSCPFRVKYSLCPQSKKPGNASALVSAIRLENSDVERGGLSSFSPVLASSLGAHTLKKGTPDCREVLKCRDYVIAAITVLT